MSKLCPNLLGRAGLGDLGVAVTDSEGWKAKGGFVALAGVCDACVGAKLKGVSVVPGKGEAFASGEAGLLSLEGVVVGKLQLGLGIDDAFGRKSGGRGASSAFAAAISSDLIDSAGDNDGEPLAPRSTGGLPAPDGSLSSAGPLVAFGDGGKGANSAREAEGEGGKGGSSTCSGRF